MNECQQLHETIVRDIFDVITSVKDFDQVEWLRKKNDVGSIAKRASNLVLVFPVIVSNSITIQTASIISKAIERKCVSLLQILFSSVQLTSADNMRDYIKQFHTNLDSHMTLDDFMNTMDELVESNLITVTDKDVYEAVREDMQNINYMLDESFNPVSLNDYRCRRNIYGESSIIREAKGGSYAVVDTDKFTKAVKGLINKSVDAGIKSRADEIDKMGANRKNDVDYFRYQLLNQDVQKANELMPTTMLVNFTTVVDGVKNTTTGVVGVKAKLYPVDAMDIVTRLSAKYKDTNALFNLVRASTREISFFRDLAFAIDKAKIDAVNMARESNNAKMFKVLERRAAKNRFSSLLKKNDASPITSLVISQDEVEYLKKYSNLDMEKSYVTRSILEAYNLMDIVIADESLEVAKFLFDDGDGVYEVLSFDALEKEAKDSSYKKVVNLMSKLNR
jgi:hypothetical protein